MGRYDGLTQALAVSLAGIVLLIFEIVLIGPIVDMFVWLAATLELNSAMGIATMPGIMVFAKWFYYIIYFLGVLFVIYPVIFIIKRHRYMDVEPTQFDEQTQGQ